MDFTFKSPVILSLCPGILGLERGIERAIGPLRIAAYVEIEAFIISNLVAKMEAGILAPAPVWSDCTTFPGHHFYGKIHGIIGGYPCQPFSVAGKMQGEKSEKHLWPHIARHIASIRPVFTFFENVPNHLNIGFRQVYQDLEAMDYHVEAGLYSARECGAPQFRKRLFIFAVANAYRSGKNRKPGNAKKAIDKKQIDIQNKKRCKPEHSNDDGRMEHPDGRLCGNIRPEYSQEYPNPCLPGTIPDPGSQYVQITEVTAGNQPVQQQPGITCSAKPAGPWPAGRYQPQYHWEAPRIVESGLGCTVNGYNYREDILRAIGNSVVEQTAEIAFRDLYFKQFNQYI